ncbi:MAG TPA: hypothetical protein VJ838_15965 [Gaiellaceae bacterium]|nr:hypothetical protein [Gaiellaceae bacterium]
MKGLVADELENERSNGRAEKIEHELFRGTRRYVCMDLLRW